jgi:hypothetical protein
MAHKTSLFFQKKKILVAAAALAGMTSWMACTKFDLGMPEIQANPEFAAAIGKFSFLFSDFIKGDSLIQVGRDSSIALRYAKDSIVGYSVADIVNRATGGVGGNINKNTVLGAVSVPNLTMNQTTTLSQFGASFAPPLSTLFTMGGTVPPIPATGIPAFSSAANVTNNLAPLTDFQTVTLASGMISLQVTNNFPFAINNLVVELLNQNGTSIATIPIPSNGATITTGSSAAGTADLTGKTMTNLLSYRIGTLSSPGIPANTVISPTSTMSVAVTTTNMKVRSGNVKVNQQTLAGDNIVASLATANAAQKLVQITLRSAKINYTITKTTPINMRMTLNFPTITKGLGGLAYSKIIDVIGNSTSGSINLGRAEAGSTLDAIADLSSIVAQPYNQLPITVGVEVLSSNGAYVAINEADVVTINATFANLEVGGARGQFGTFEMDIPSTTQAFGADFGFLSPESARLFFANPSLKLKYVNSFGLPLSASLSMTANGILPGSEPLGSAATQGKVNFNFSYPRIAAIGTAAQLVKDSVVLNKNTSNIVAFMGILPKNISSSGKVFITSSGPEVNYFTYDSRIKLGLEMDIPMKFSAENLTVRDTVDTFAGVLKPEQVQYVEYVAMDIQYKTRLPLGVTVDLATLVNGSLTTVVKDILLPAADTIDADGKVTAPKSGTSEVKLTAAQLSQLSNAPKVVLVAKIQTAKGGLTPVAMFTHYDFDMGIGVRIKTKIVK